MFSPSKRTGPNYFIGDDSDIQSPRKRLAIPMSPITADESGILNMTPRDAMINPAMKSAFRSICTDFFENNVMPVVRIVQQTQEQLMTQNAQVQQTQELLIQQIKEVNEKLDRKADAEKVPTTAEIEQIAFRASSRADDSKVALLVRMEQMAANLNKKADASNVPTMAQFKASSNSELEVRVQTAEKKV